MTISLSSLVMFSHLVVLNSGLWILALSVFTISLLRTDYNNITQNIGSCMTVQVQSKLCSDICSAACLWWFFKHRFMLLALHRTHWEPVTRPSADHSLPNGCNCSGLCWHCWHTLRRYAVAPTKPTVAHRVMFACGWLLAVDSVVCPSLFDLLVPTFWVSIRGSERESEREREREKERALWLAVYCC